MIAIKSGTVGVSDNRGGHRLRSKKRGGWFLISLFYFILVSIVIMGGALKVSHKM